jgi:hypothetical protein
MQYRYFMCINYSEGSLMPLMLTSALLKTIRDGPMPFIEPIANAIVGNVMSLFLAPNFKPHSALLEDQLKTVPDGGESLCGKDRTVADMMIFPLEAGQSKVRVVQDGSPARLGVRICYTREARTSGPCKRPPRLRAASNPICEQRRSELWNWPVGKS